MAILLSGCGADVYEARLGETVKYFEYLEKVNGALSPSVWSEFGIELRAPRQFEYLPPLAPEEELADPETPNAAPPDDRAPFPAAEEPLDGSEDPGTAAETPPFDSRQPDYMDLYLPGLLGAWKAEVNVIDGNGVKPGSAYLYVLTNHAMWLKREEEGENIDPLAFHNAALEEISSSLGLLAPSDVNPWNWEDERIPRGAGYVPKKNLAKIVQQTEIDGEPTDFIIYKYQVKDVQLLILLVVPQRIDRPLPLQNAMTYCLEQLNVSGEIPTTRGTSTSKGTSF